MMMDILNWALTAAWLGLVLWVYVDGKKQGVEKAGKWAMKMLWNPFAVRKSTCGFARGRLRLVWAFWLSISRGSALAR